MTGSHPPLRSPLAVAHIGGILLLLSLASATHGAELEGFTEPYRSIDVAVDEAGTIEEVLIREGEVVAAGQPLVRLNSEIHHALLAIAEQNMQAVGRLDAAEADLRLRRERLNKLRALRQEGHARQEEVDRAAAEVAVAEANQRSAREDQISRQLEYEKIKTQIERRTVCAPIAGVVAAVHKDHGEFVAPNDPNLLTLVQIDQLLANFTLIDSQAEKLHPGQELVVVFRPGSQMKGVVEFISPVTNAESGTVLVKVRIANSDGRFRSGQRCKIPIGE